MRLMLFLGSGISFPSGLPSVQKLTSSVLNGDWHLEEGFSFRPGPPRERGDPTRHIQAFLKLLKAYADGYFALRSGQEANYEDIYYLAQQVREDEEGRIDNPAILGFLTEIKARAHQLSERMLGIDAMESHFHNMVKAACCLIQCVVEQNLSTSKEIAGLEFIGELATSHDIERLDVFTLRAPCSVEILGGWGEQQARP